MQVLVIGHDGLLGSAVCRAWRKRGVEPITPAINWGTSRAEADLATALTTLDLDTEWVVTWCAGIGVPASPQAVFDDELATFASFCQLVRNSGKGANGTLFFPSSAGAVYAGSVNPPFDESTEPQPLAPYGYAKLALEAEAASLAAAGVRVAIARIANLYGPGQNLNKAQGLVSQLGLAVQSGHPLGIYVSLDTLRDYIYVDDAAALIVDFTLRTAAQPAGAPPVIKILSTGSSVTIAEILGEIRNLTKRRPPVVLAASPHRKVQARDLRMKSKVWPELDRRPYTPFPVGVATTIGDVGRRWRTKGAS